MRLRAGIVGSSGGSALAAACDCIATAGHELELAVITDRDCGMHSWASRSRHLSHRIGFSNVAAFSRAACEYFTENACADILLFYTRLVAEPLIDSLRVWNIHPALLPSFPGLGAVQQAWVARVRVLGATLHRVDAGLDTGPIVAQIAMAQTPDSTLRRWQRVSYVQKVYLTLLWFEHVASAVLGGPRALDLTVGSGLANPGIVDQPLLDAFQAWEASLEPAPESN